MTNGETLDGTPPPEEGEAPIRPAGGSGIVMGLKIFAIISGVLALVMIILMPIGRPETEGTTVLGLTDANMILLGQIMGVMGLIFGVIGIFIGPRRISKLQAIPPLNAIMLGIGTLCFLAGGMMVVWNDPRYAEVTGLDIYSLLYILLYAWFLLWFVELSSTSTRYAVVDDYIKEHNIGDFSLNPVIGTYFGWFFMLMIVILALSTTVVVWTPQFLVEMTRNYGYEQLADSIMFNSVYGVAISMGVWFTIIGLVLTFAYSFVEDTKKEVIQKKATDEF